MKVFYLESLELYGSNPDSVQQPCASTPTY